MKKKVVCVLSVCLHRDKKKASIYDTVVVIIDGKNIVGFWIIEIRESESIVRFLKYKIDIFVSCYD